MILPDNRAQVRRGGGVSGGSAKSPSLTFFLFLKPSLIAVFFEVGQMSPGQILIGQMLPDKYVWISCY